MILWWKLKLFIIQIQINWDIERKKSCIGETLNLSTDADNNTDTKRDIFF